MESYHFDASLHSTVGLQMYTNWKYGSLRGRMTLELVEETGWMLLTWRYYTCGHGEHFHRSGAFIFTKLVKFLVLNVQRTLIRGWIMQNFRCSLLAYNRVCYSLI
jgi:hypothetical protein